jgi:hypothetical protein
MEDDKHTSQPRTVRNELRIQEVAMFVHANHYQNVEEVAGAAGISHGTCHKILTYDQNMSEVTWHSVLFFLTQDQCDRMSTCGD